MLKEALMLLTESCTVNIRFTRPLPARECGSNTFDLIQAHISALWPSVLHRQALSVDLRLDGGFRQVTQASAK